MNLHLRASIDAVNRNGLTLTYSSITKTIDKINSTVVEVLNNHSVKIYPKNIVTTQYNYPDLIGKNVVMFYLANDSLTFVPNVGDVITYNGLKYKIQSFTTHVAKGQICLYKLLGVKG